MNTYQIYSTNNPKATVKIIEAESKQEALDKYCYSYGLVDYADFVKIRSSTGAKVYLYIGQIVDNGDGTKTYKPAKKVK